MARLLRKYAFNVLVAIDQFVNAVLGGDPDETLSSRAAKRADQPGWKQLCWLLEKIDPGHLDKSREDDEGSGSLF